MNSQEDIHWVSSQLVPLVMGVNGVVSVMYRTADSKTTILVAILAGAFHPASSAVLTIYTGCLMGRPQRSEFELQMLPLRAQLLPACLGLEEDWEILA